MRLKMMSSPMKHLLGMADNGQQRKGRFNHEAVIPGAFQTQLQIVRHTSFTAKTEIGQDQAIGSQQLDQWQKVLVWTVHGQPMPANDLSQAVENPAHLQANRPPPFISILRSNLPSRASLTERKQQLNRETIDDIEQTGFGQQAVRLMFIAPQLPLKRCSLRQATKQSVIVSFQPAIKRPKAPTLERKQNADGDHFTRIQFRIAFLCHHSQPIIDSAKNQDDNLFRRHESPSIWLQHLYCRPFS